MKNLLKGIWIIILIFFFACNSSTKNKEKDPLVISDQKVNELDNPKEITLTKGEAVSRAIAGGEKYIFSFYLDENQFIYLKATQKEIDFKLTLYPPGSDTLIIYDTPNGQRGMEEVYFISDKAGNYKLELEPFSQYAELAGFDIELESVRPMTIEDKKWMLVYDRMRTANIMRGKKEMLDSAALEFEKIIPLWSQMGDTYQEAVARRSLGYTLRSMGKKEEAIKMFESVLPLWQQVDETRNEAFTYLILAGIYKTDNYFEKAIPLTLQAIEKWEESEDIIQESKAYSDLASFYMMSGDFAQAKKFYEKSIKKAEESGSLSVQGIMLREYGNAWQTFNDDKMALNYYNAAISKYQEMNHLPAEALVDRMAGDFLFNKNKKQESLGYFQEALEIYIVLGDETMIDSMHKKISRIN